MGGRCSFQYQGSGGTVVNDMDSQLLSSCQCLMFTETVLSVCAFLGRLHPFKPVFSTVLPRECVWRGCALWRWDVWL